MIKYRIELLPEERAELVAKAQKGKAMVKTVRRSGAFYSVFGAEQAKSYLDRLEFVYTPRRSTTTVSAPKWPRPAP